jgi:hypothetical protein
MTRRKPEKGGQQIEPIEFHSSVDLWQKSRDEQCPLCALLLLDLPNPVLNDALSVSTLRSFLEEEFSREDYPQKPWPSSGQTFEAWSLNPLDAWTGWLSYLDQSMGGATARAKNAVAIYRRWETQSKKIPAGSALSRSPAQIARTMLAGETGGPVIKEDYARRGWILELHLALCSEYRVFRVYSQLGKYTYVIQRQRESAIFHTL